MLEQPQSRLENTAARPESPHNALFQAGYGDQQVRSASTKPKAEQATHSGELKFDSIPGYDAPKSAEHASARTVSSSTRMPESAAGKPQQASAASAEHPAGKADGAHRSEAATDPNKASVSEIRNSWAQRNKHGAEFGPTEGSDNTAKPGSAQASKPESEANQATAPTIRNNWAQRYKHAAEFGPEGGADKLTPPSTDKPADKR